jgi:hypothetical protein
VIGVCVRDDREGEASGVMPQEKGGHDPSAGIIPIALRTGIDEHPVPSRGTQQLGITLPDIEKM